jgi:DNA-binding MarR family transcriptional regulator
MKPLPMREDGSIVEHIATGLAKVAMALRSQAWEGGMARGLTPTQGQILALLAGRAGRAMRVKDVAEALAMTVATASAAVATLEQKKLLRKERSLFDSRALGLSLTAAGRREAQFTGGWSDVVRAGIQQLTPDEQKVFLRGLSKVMHSLQEQGVISTVRMCAGCTYFRPYVHADSAKPHHCDCLGTPMGEGQLRLDCSEFVPAPHSERASRWRRFSTEAESIERVKGSRT